MVKSIVLRSWISCKGSLTFIGVSSAQAGRTGESSLGKKENKKVSKGVNSKEVSLKCNNAKNK